MMGIYLYHLLPVSSFPFWRPYSYDTEHAPWIGKDRDIPLAFLVVSLISNCAVQSLWFLPQHCPFHLLVYRLPLPFWVSFGSTSISWAISKQYIYQMLWPSCRSPHSRGLSSLRVGIMANWTVLSVQDSTDFFDTIPSHKGIQTDTRSTIIPFLSWLHLWKYLPLNPSL